MNAISITVQHADTHAAEPKTHLLASENLDFGAQVVVGLKVLAGLAAVVGVTQAMSALTIWMYPFWAQWF